MIEKEPSGLSYKGPPTQTLRQTDSKSHSACRVMLFMWMERHIRRLHQTKCLQHRVTNEFNCDCAQNEKHMDTTRHQLPLGEKICMTGSRPWCLYCIIYVSDLCANFMVSQRVKICRSIEQVDKSWFQRQRKKNKNPRWPEVFKELKTGLVVI